MRKQEKWIGVAGVCSHPDQYPDTPIGYGRFEFLDNGFEGENAGSIDQGPSSTDALAEYGAILRTLEFEEQHNPSEEITLHLFSKNEGVVSQIQGDSQIDDPRLQECRNRAVDLFDKFDYCELRYPTQEHVRLTTRAKELAKKYCGAPHMARWDLCTENSPEATMYQYRIRSRDEGDGWHDILNVPAHEGIAD